MATKLSLFWQTWWQTASEHSSLRKNDQKIINFQRVVPTLAGLGGCKNDQKNQGYGSHDGPHLPGAAPKHHEEEKVLAWMGVLFLS